MSALTKDIFSEIEDKIGEKLPNTALYTWKLNSLHENEKSCRSTNRIQRRCFPRVAVISLLALVSTRRVFFWVWFVYFFCPVWCSLAPTVLIVREPATAGTVWCAHKQCLSKSDQNMSGVGDLFTNFSMVGIVSLLIFAIVNSLSNPKPLRIFFITAGNSSFIFFPRKLNSSERELCCCVVCERSAIFTNPSTNHCTNEYDTNDR